jgi:predicted phosphodiesterase
MCTAAMLLLPPVSALALLYDMHGNLPALEAVLADAREQGADAFLLGGDYALFGPWPAETLRALRELPKATWVRGNVDRWTAFPDQVAEDAELSAAVSACRHELGDESAAWLGGLAEQTLLEGTLYCHASPHSDVQSFLPDPGEDDDELLDGVSERRVVFGHTHLQFRRERGDGTELVNPGSVGMPLDGDHRAAYALVDDGGELELRRVGYDHEASARAVSERFGEAEWAARTTRRLQNARP